MSGDDSNRLPETPDVSLGSLCQNTTGEELDDILFDQIYDSPNVSSMSCGEGGGGPSSGTSFNLRSTLSGRSLWPTQRPDGNYCDFDALSLIDVNVAMSELDDESWLSKPPGEIPSSFSEEDRSYLDTSLLNLRFSLLNIVSADINGTLRGIEEHGPASCPPPVPDTFSEITNGSATIKLTRSALKKHFRGAGDYNQATGSSGAFGNDSYTHDENHVENDIATSTTYSPVRNFGGTISIRSRPNYDSPLALYNTSGYNDSDISSPASRNVPYLRDQSPLNTTFSADPSEPLVNDGNSTLCDNEDNFNSRTICDDQRVMEQATRLGLNSVSPSYTMRVHDPARDVEEAAIALTEGAIPPSRVLQARPSYTIARHGSADPGAVDHTSPRTSPSYAARYGNQDTGESGASAYSRVPSGRGSPSYTVMRHGTEGILGLHNDLTTETLSPITKYQPPPNTMSPRRNLLRDLDELGNRDGSDDINNLTFSEDSYSQSGHPSSREIDSRTYTRNKKTRMSIATPSRQLNTTMELSPQRPTPGSPSRRLNTTMTLSPEHNTQGAASATNLNETFDATDDINTEGSSDRRRVKRNESYVIRREQEESKNNNTLHHASPASGAADLNSTFTFDGNGDVETLQNSRMESHNNSMEGLNSRVESQIRSLGCNQPGVPRGRFSDQNERVMRQIEDARLVGRTLSTDTYSLAQSSDSASSDLSSPMDAQSYDDLQTNEAVRRSMPNLASRGTTGIRTTVGFPQIGGGQLRKKDYMVSDSRLTRLGSADRPRLSVMTSESRNMGFSRGSVTSGSSSSRATDRNTSNPSLNRPSGINSGMSYQGQGLGLAGRRELSSVGRPSNTMTITRPSTAPGLQGPRYMGAPSGIARPPRSASGIPRGAPRSGLPVPAYRSQSRFAAPGQIRSSIPGQPRSPVFQPRQSELPKTKDWQDGCY